MWAGRCGGCAGVSRPGASPCTLRWRRIAERAPPDPRARPPPALATRYPSQLASGPLGATVGLALNTRAWPFKARAGRQAVSYAIDRKRLIDLAGGPLAAQPTCQILPPGQPGYEP